MKNEMYNLRTDGDQFRITKFLDGDVAATYLLTETECECPAGVRPTCRHRQMLPTMLALGLCNTHWFWDRDANAAFDINGYSKTMLDALAAGAPAPAMLVQAEGPEIVTQPATAPTRPAWRRI